MDKFFTQKHCDRCGKSLSGGRTMSMFNMCCICMECKDKETKRANYDKAVQADHSEIKKAITISKELDFKGGD